MYGYYSNYRQAIVEHRNLDKLLELARKDDHIGDIWYKDSNGVVRVIGHYNAHTNEYRSN